MISKLKDFEMKIASAASIIIHHLTRKLYLGQYTSLMYLQFNAYAQFKPQINCVAAEGLNFGLSVHLHPLFVYASSEGSGECAD